MNIAMSEPLFVAILSMDSYNRHYKQGINFDGTTIGKADLLPSELPTGYEAASFFAQAYQWNGKTVIAYRGTDDSPLR